MATKAGRAQFKDIRQGRTLWLVQGGQTWKASATHGGPGVWYYPPEKIFVTHAPFRTQVDGTKGLVDEWTFAARKWWSDGLSSVFAIDCTAHGIPAPGITRFFTESFVFTTQKAALRYIKRFSNYRLADSYEHPRQFKHHIWPNKYLRPYQFLVNGVVCDHTTPPETIEFYMEQSRRELAMMYPHVITPLLVNPEELKKWAGDPEAFEPIDPKTYYPGSVIVGMDVFNDPVKRAELEKDFVVIGYDPGSDTAARVDVKVNEDGTLQFKI